MELLILELIVRGGRRDVVLLAQSGRSPCLGPLIGAESSIPLRFSTRTQAPVLPERFRSDSICGGSDSNGA
jgi:hypothetical protein